ncbi:hypothetical protein OC25_05435 [Pedobacter kyungheensis]|uniref:Teneurin NHL domain-containing protein n=1 Tax=Pedobacter kyungheensis TaxID=1069985 RepID=A0A0C1FVT2_9SPHI|nr:hypothetical protein OC25_05435 [Pedobacter kyungheensis]
MFSCKEKIQPPDNNQNSKIESNISVVSTIAGKYLSKIEYLNSPIGLVADKEGNMYVADENAKTIRKISPDGKISLFAGSNSGEGGFRNGKGDQALFQSVQNLAIDAHGNILVVDMSNSMIRKIDPYGNVTTLAGNGKLAVVDGPAANASFYFPRGIAINSRGEIYISDNSSMIRKIDLNGNVTTVAGAMQSGYRDGQAGAALFNLPFSLVFDRSDNLYISDRQNQRIRVMNSNGQVSTLAGSGNIGNANGQGIAASFFSPAGIALDAAGNLFVAETGNHLIRKITPTGLVSTFGGTGVKGNTNGLLKIASFSNPQALCFDNNGILYIAEYGNHSIRKVSANGEVEYFYGDVSPTEGAGLSVYFNHPDGIVVDKHGNVYVADMDNNMIRKITTSGLVSTIAGAATAGYRDGLANLARFSSPMGLSINQNEEIFVADKNNSVIRKISASGTVSTVTFQRPVVGMQYPNAVYADKIGSLYYSDLESNHIFKIKTNGEAVMLTSMWGVSGNGSFWLKPSAIQMDGKGQLYVVDNGNHTICRSIDDGLNFLAIAGKRGYGNFSVSGNTNGPGETATFNRPKGMAIDAAGNIYIADSENHLIRKLSATGIVTTIAGSGVAGYADGVAVSAKFNKPSGLALNADGTILYVTDQDNHLVRKIVLGN